MSLIWKSPLNLFLAISLSSLIGPQLPSFSQQSDRYLLAQAQLTQLDRAELVNLYRRSSELYQQEKFVEALKPLQQALKLSRQMGNRLEEMKAVISLGFVHFSIGQKDIASEYANEFLKALQIHSELAVAYLQFYEIEYSIYKAEYDWRRNNHKKIEYLEIYRDNSLYKNHQIQRTILYYLGMFYWNEDRKKASEIFRQSWSLEKTIPKLPDNIRKEEASNFMNFTCGTRLLAMSCEPNIQRTLNIARELKESDLERAVLERLARLYQQNEKYKEYLQISQQLIKFPESDLRELFFGIGVSYFRLGDYEQAISYYDLALQDYSVLNNKYGQHKQYDFQIDSYLKSVLFDSLGDSYRYLRDYNKAITYYQKSLELKPSAQTLISLGAVLLESGKIDDADKNIMAGMRIWNAVDARQGRKSDEYFIIHGESPEPADSPRPPREIQWDLRPYSLAQQLFVSRNDTSRALEFSEITRALSLLQLIRMPSSRRVELSKYQGFHASFTRSTLGNAQQVQEIAKAHNASLVEYSIIYDDKALLRGQVKVSQLFMWVVKPSGEINFRRKDFGNYQQIEGDLQSLVVNSRHAVITRSSNTNSLQALSVGNYVKLKDDLPNWQPWQIVATNHTKQTLTLTHPTFEAGVTVERPVTDVVRDLTSTRTIDPQLQQLYQLLIAPIADLLPTDPNAQVIFIPQGELSFVPFPALQQPDGTYLIEKHTILTAPSIQVLDLTRQQRNRLREGNSLVVGIPRNAVVTRLGRLALSYRAETQYPR